MHRGRSQGKLMDTAKFIHESKEKAENAYKELLTAYMTLLAISQETAKQIFVPFAKELVAHLEGLPETAREPSCTTEDWKTIRFACESIHCHHATFSISRAKLTS